MKISYNWLKQYINVDLSVSKVSEMLTDLGLEVEGIEEYCSVPGGLQGVVVGEVLSCEQHPNADRLKRTKVALGNDKIVPIVCGAPNVAAGQKVAVATVGTTLYDGEGTAFQIKKSKIRGELSEGMICAEDELNLGDSHDGILVLNESLQAGTLCSEVFEIENDTVFEIGLTPNRADAMSHMGVARDLNAACVLQGIQADWSTPEVSSFHIDQQSHPIEIQVKDPNKAPRYIGLMIRDIQVGPSPDWLQNRLKAIGISPKNNIVDITNFVLHDLGQPLHAFDADKIKGNIKVQTVAENTPFVTLDGEERKLDADDLMICDDEKPLCIAGVFGGIDSGVGKETKHVFLEAAYFDPVSIRKTAKRHGLNTDASFRYERGIDPLLTEYAIKRAAILIKKLAGGTISSELIEIALPEPNPKQLFLQYNQLKDVIGQEIPKEKLTLILNALDITIESVSETGIGLSIPPYRVDVTRAADVIEEILRVYGYNSITAAPSLQMPFPNFDSKSAHQIEELLAQTLVGMGFSEIINNSLSSPAYQKLDPSLQHLNGVHLLNPLGQELSQLRSSLLFSSLETIGFNLNRQAKNLKLFEIGKTYASQDSDFIERKYIALSLVGSPFDENWDSSNPPTSFSFFKGAIESLWARLAIDISSCDYSDHPTYSEGIEWRVGAKIIGRMGIVATSITKEFSIDKTVYYAELDWELVRQYAFQKELTLSPISKFPTSRRDFALLISTEISFHAIESLAFKTERKLLQKVGLFDVYQGKNLAKDQKSYGVSFEFQDPNKTLTDKQIDKIMKKLQTAFESELEAQLR